MLKRALFKCSYYIIIIFIYVCESFFQPMPHIFHLQTRPVMSSVDEHMCIQLVNYDSEISYCIKLRQIVINVLFSNA